MKLLTVPRLQPAFGRLEAVVLALYTLVLAITIPFHEPWADEAQAWLLARDSSLPELFLVRLHYEGHPGLWHFILWIAARLHMPYAGIGVISAAFAIAGIYVFLRYSPFPLFIRIFLPFTFFFQYQHAVISRSYSVIPVLLFASCVIFGLERPRPLLFAITAGLLANLSLYTLVYAAVMALLYLPILWSRRSLVPKVQALLAGALFSASLLFGAYTALPAWDISSPGSIHRFEAGHPKITRLLPGEPTPAGWEKPPPADFSLGGKIQYPKDEAIHSRGNAIQHAIIMIEHPLNRSYTLQTFGHRFTAVMLSVSGLFYSISTSNVLAFAFLLTAFLWLTSRHALRYALPLLSLLLFGTLIPVLDHHAGLFLLGLITAFWFPWQRPAAVGSREAALTSIFSILFFIVILQQIWWTAYAVVTDIEKPYDPAPATARWLQQHASGKRIAGLEFATTSLKPYLDPHRIENQPRSYWLWSTHYPVIEALPAELASHPDILVIAHYQWGDHRVENQIVPEAVARQDIDTISPAFIAAYGYHEETRLCGDWLSRNGTTTIYCNIIYTLDPGPRRVPDLLPSLPAN